jgi:putative SOS response-associated peptidase YedK
MPVIVAPISYDRWLSHLDPDPQRLDLLVIGAMTMWPFSTKVNKPENDDPSILEPVDEPLKKERW